MSKKIVLITGASSGIGAATARRLAASGHQVVLGARRTDRLAALAAAIRDDGGAAEYAALDVTSPDSVEAFVQAAHRRHGRIDVLVNNAGVMPLSRLDALRVEEWNQMIDVNLRGVLHGIAAVLPLMRAQRSGHVINVSSTLGHDVVPNSAVYSATKFAVRALAEGLRKEQQDIRVTVVSPSFTESELNTLGGDPDTMAWVRTMADKLNMPAGTVADAIAYAIEQPASIDVSEIVVRPLAEAAA
ncbi:SDR family oxidoreductase [Nonomuraea jiangxiensis]|uniref:NADP-dependent 3-hydroxy acid dehydrogenase YdfG n=1 Tax=Nonomuraea jiangxiensis TaxID=633440 RepID=A0A1G8J8Y6_9ACTN|nr:SDR family oxidoreductase [Nonomuraea jiangxiensis]SDI27724.1 NADP-dependent 3-hydroxy acid dehydrogenase YdfG [Nonomuraea jiangxiensis]